MTEGPPPLAVPRNMTDIWPRAMLGSAEVLVGTIEVEASNWIELQVRRRALKRLEEKERKRPNESMEEGTARPRDVG